VTIVKAKEAAQVREKQFQYQQLQKQKEEEKKYNLEKKNDLLVDYNFTELTRDRALMKLTEAAKKYDRTHPAAVSLDGFTGQSLSPTEFKEILKRTFGLKLTAGELGALIREFETRGPQGGQGQQGEGEREGRVECSEFLITFFKLGYVAREKELTEQRERQQQQLIEMEQRQANKLKELEDKVELLVDYDFSEADEARMLAKLKEAAKKYDRYHPAAMSLEGFDVQVMKPGVFREMLKRTFNLILTSKELGAVVKTFDKVGDGTIPCRDFLMFFHQMGYSEKNHDRHLQLQKQRELDKLSAEETNRKLKAIEEKVSVPIAEKYEPSDLERAHEKIRVAALKYDRTHPSAMNLDGFNGSFLSPGVFREMLKRTFNIHLTPTELKAMVDVYDTNRRNLEQNEQKINCTEFLKQFFKFSFDEKSKIHREILNQQRESERCVAEEKRRKQREAEEKMEQEVDYSFTEQEKQKGLEKVKKAAIKYDKNHPSAPCLDGFSGAFMSPSVFKNMLFRAFGIKLSAKELGAVMTEFDKDHNGTIDCAEFLNSFFRLGFECRSEYYHQQLEKQKLATYHRERAVLLKLQQQEEKMNLKIDWDFTDTDLETIKEKMTEAAKKYDKNHPASISLDGFETKTLSPGIFREMIRRTFNIHLTPRELAAMLTLFEADKNGNIETRNFITKFMRIGLDERYKFKTEMIERQRVTAKRVAEERVEKIAAQWKKLEEMVEINYQYDIKDEESLFTKLKKVARKYEKNAISSPSLDGFTPIFLPPGVCKEMLKRTFNLTLSPTQLGVLIKKFEHPQHENCLNCAVFVNYFLSLGHQERNQYRVIQEERKRKYEQEQKLEMEKKMNDLRAKNELKLSSSTGESGGDGDEEGDEGGRGGGGGRGGVTYSEMDRRKMISKLTTAAFKYDRVMPGAMSLDGFDALYLTPTEFKEIIKRTFNLRLELEELKALIDKYDPSRSGRIISKDFLNDFLSLGIKEREKLKIKNLEKNRREIKLQKQEELRKLNELKQKKRGGGCSGGGGASAGSDHQMIMEFTIEEQKLAFEKLTKSAMRYDKNHSSSSSFDGSGFDVATISYDEFRELLKQILHLTLSDGEFAAIVSYFDPRNQHHTINSKEFLIYFNKLSFNEKQKFHTEILRKDRETIATQQQEEKEKLEMKWAQRELQIDWNFSEQDLDTALKKLTVAAKEYDPNHPSAMSLTAFETLTMSPAVFREMLKRIMNITLTNKELSALVTHFDRENDHTVTCADFLVKFLSLGFSERNKILQKNREKVLESQKKKVEEDELKEKIKCERMEARVDYDFTHEQFASTMEKLKVAASTYDRNHPAAVGLDGFQGSNLTPGVFREMLKRTFNIKLDPGELGAAVKFFDSDGDGTIDTAEFLKHFFKLQRTERSNIRRQRIQAEREVKKKLEDEVKDRSPILTPSLCSSDLLVEFGKKPSKMRRK
jgi:Ca2+-binding EF-hand superfamily protein